jgi:biotin carboxylase
MQVVFVAPYALETTLRFVRGAAALPGVRLGVISQDPAERFSVALGKGLAAYQRVKEATDAQELGEAVRTIARDLHGHVDRLIGVLEQLQEPMAEVRERFRIRGMDRDEARNFRDKARMKDVLRAHGLPCARHVLAHGAAEALAFAEACLPLVVKPPAGAGARNTFRVDTRARLEAYLKTSPPSAEEPLLLEEFIQGREHSFDSVTLQRHHLLHSISRYSPGPLEVMQKDWVQWCVVLPRHVDSDEFEDIHAVGRRALDALGMVTGITHMEWFRRPDSSLAISEVAARPPGAQFTSLLSYAHDLDFYRAWPRLMLFEEFEKPQRAYAVGALYLRGRGQGKVQRVEGAEAAQSELGDLLVEARFPEIGQAKATSYEGEGYVILRHPETQVVESGLRRLLELVRVELG